MRFKKMPEPQGFKAGLGIIFCLSASAVPKNRSPQWRMSELYRFLSVCGEVNTGVFLAAFRRKKVLGPYKICLTPNTANMTPNTATLTPITDGLTPIDAGMAPDGDSVAPNGANLASNDSALNEPGLTQYFEKASIQAFSQNKASGQISSLIDSLRAASLTRDSKSIRIHLNIKSSDIGFEALHSQLASFNEDADRTKHIKRTLNLILLGQNVQAGAQSRQSDTESVDQSFRITFRLSARDTGLDKLYASLCAIVSASERNRFVKRCLFNGFASSAVNTPGAVPAASHTNLEPSPAYPIAFVNTAMALSPWAAGNSTADVEALTPEQSAAKRAGKRKAAIDRLI